VRSPQGAEADQASHGRDPLDQSVLKLALAAKTDALITGDRDLLALAGAFAVPILAPAALRNRLSKDTEL